MLGEIESTNEEKLVEENNELNNETNFQLENNHQNQLTVITLLSAEIESIQNLLASIPEWFLHDRNYQTLPQQISKIKQKILDYKATVLSSLNHTKQQFSEQKIQFISEKIQIFYQKIKNFKTRLIKNLIIFYYYLGIELSKRKNYQGAIQCFDNAIQFDSNLYQAYKAKGDALCCIKQFLEAINCYDQSLKIKQDYQPAYTNYYNALAEFNNLKKPQISLLRRLCNFRAIMCIAFIVIGYLHYYIFSRVYFIEVYQYSNCQQTDLIDMFQSFCIQQSEPPIGCKDNPLEFYKLVCEACFLAKKQNYHQALKFLYYAWTINSNDYFLTLLLANNLIRMKEYETALIAFDHGINMKQDVIDFFLHKHQLLVALRRFEDANEFVRTSILKFPYDYRPYHLYGNELFEVQLYHEAINMFDQSILLKPNFCESHFQKGKALSKIMKFQEAMDVFDQSLQYCASKIKIVHFNKCKILFEKQQYEEVLNIIENYLYDPNLWENLQKLKESNDEIILTDKQSDLFEASYDKIIYLQGMCLKKLGQSEEAIKAFDKVIYLLQPKNPLVYYLKGEELQRLGKYQEAIEQFEKGLSFEPNNIKIILNIATLLEQLQNYNEAEKNYNRAIIQKLSNLETWYQFGLFLVRINKFEDAISVFQYIILHSYHTCDQDFMKQVKYQLGKCLFYQNKYEESIVFLDRALQFDENFRDALLYKSFAVIHSGEYEKAIIILDQLLELNPNDEEAIIEKGITLFKLNKLEEAMQYYDQISDNSSFSNQADLYKGMTLYYMNNFEEALRMVDKSISKHPNNPEAYYFQGLILESLGYNKKAIESYKIVLNLDPHHTEAYHRKQMLQEVSQQKQHENDYLEDI